MQDKDYEKVALKILKLSGQIERLIESTRANMNKGTSTSKV